MDDGTKLKPWGAPPIKGTFAIAFETEIGKPAKKFEVSNGDLFNVISFPNSNKIYDLVYQNNILISFVPKNDAFKVSFEKVGLKPGTTNIVRGFLVIETSVGTVTQVATRVTCFFQGTPIDFPMGADPNKVLQQCERLLFKKVEGHYMFSILLTDPANPDFCVPERDNLLKLSQFLVSEQAILRRLNSDFATAPIAEKQQIQKEITEKQAEISQLKVRISQAQKILEECQKRPR